MGIPAESEDDSLKHCNTCADDWVTNIMLNPAQAEVTDFEGESSKKSGLELAKA